jgi:hypothetical protein
MSTSTDTIPAPPTGADSATVLVDPHAQIRRLTEQLTELTAAHDALRNGISRELTTLVALRHLRGARPQPRPDRDVLDDDDTIFITDVVALDAEDTSRRPRLRVAATVSLAVTLDSRRADTVWTPPGRGCGPTSPACA